MKKLMKILFLNPHVDAQHKITRALKAAGMAVLKPSSADEAWQVLKLHGTSVDLAIIHREGIQGGDPGIELLYKIKKDPSQADLAVIFTSETWTPEQSASHQRTPMGANAYLRWPFDESALLQTINAVFGATSEARTGVSIASSAANAAQVERAAPRPPKTGEFVLEDPSGIFATANSHETSIKLEAPEGQIELSNPGRDPVIETASSAPSPSLEISVPVEAPEMGEASIEASVHDVELSREMPYLFPKGEKPATIGAGAFASAFAQPVGDAVIPGGAASAPDAETLKKYLMLREQDVAALSAQLKAARDELGATKAEFAAACANNEDLQYKVEDQGRKIEDFEREKAIALEGVQAELEELRFQAKAKADKAKLLETQVHEASTEIERLKERVRSDIRKIRVRERELENKLEIAKKDSEAILAARENKIIELKRKLDLLEFNMDLLQDRYAREKENSTKLREKVSKAAQVVRVAEGLLDEPGSQGSACSGASTAAPGDAETKAS